MSERELKVKDIRIRELEDELICIRRVNVSLLVSTAALAIALMFFR